jgi:PilZ domain
MATDFCAKDVLSLCVDWDSPSSTRATVDQFLAAVASAPNNPFSDRRSSKRKPVMIDVIAVPLDARFQPCGDAFLAITRDISHGGAAILCTEEVKAPYLLLRLETTRHRSLQSTIRVIRSRSFYQFREISGAFVLTEEERQSTPEQKEPKAARRRSARTGSSRRTTKGSSKSHKRRTP